jgi:hypothetical protein
MIDTTISGLVAVLVKRTSSADEYWPLRVIAEVEWLTVFGFMVMDGISWRPLWAGLILFCWPQWASLYVFLLPQLALASYFRCLYGY